MSKLVEAAVGKKLAKHWRAFVKRSRKESSRRETVTAARIADLEADLGFLAMLHVATLKLLDDKGILKGDELVPRLMMADLLDGVEDGSLSVASLRGAIGLPASHKKAGKKTGTRKAKKATAKAKPAAKPKRATKRK